MGMRAYAWEEQPPCRVIFEQKNSYIMRHTALRLTLARSD